MRWTFYTCCAAALVCAVLVTCNAQGNQHWWRTTNFYQVYPRSFKDSDGDGIGDLKGIAQMASYFRDIGVDAIWLSPIMMSPMADFGYDVSNFTEIDPIFGTMDDFKVLAKAYEDVGVKLLVDFVPNHSSDEHPWFQKSLNNTPPYNDFYIWDDGKMVGGNHTAPNNWLSVFQGSAWQWSEKRNQFYYHAFLKKQPDFNYSNPILKEKMTDVLKFWLDLGVDGFRLDSANYLFECADRSQNESVLPGKDGTHWEDYNHTCTQNQQATHELLEYWAELLYNYSVAPGGKPRALFVEVYTDEYNTMKYYGKGNTSLMQPFNFLLLVRGSQSLRAPDIKDIIDLWMSNMPDGDVANWVVGNHDNGRIADRYGREMVDAMNLLTGVLPGVKVTYYGAEIGMQDTFVRWDQTQDPSGLALGCDNYLKATRDPERTPMQWDSSPNAGFSTNSSTWLPVNPNYWWLNVEAQRAAERSHLKVFQAMAQARKDPVLKMGVYKVFAPDNDTLIVIRSLNESFYVLVMNMGSVMRTYNPKMLLPDLTLPPGLGVQIVTASLGFDGYKIGDNVSLNSLNLSMRPKSAVLLRSNNSSTSSAGSLALSLPLALIAAFALLARSS